MNRCRFARVTTALAVAAALLAAAPSHAAPSAPVGPQYDATATARLLAEVNAHRTSIGLHALAYDARLADVAKDWTLAMATSGTLSHNDALFTSASHHALDISFLGENVGDTWAPDRFEPMFLASPHHRENMESPRFALAGFAVFLDTKGQYWATEDFGSARTVAASAPAAAPAPRRVVAAARPAVHVAVRHVAAAPARHVAAPAVHAVHAVAPPLAGRSPAVDAVPAAAVTPVVPAAPSRTVPALAAFGLVAVLGGAMARRRARLAG